MKRLLELGQASSFVFSPILGMGGLIVFAGAMSGRFGEGTAVVPIWAAVLTLIGASLLRERIRNRGRPRMVPA